MLRKTLSGTAEAGVVRTFFGSIASDNGDPDNGDPENDGGGGGCFISAIKPD